MKDLSTQTKAALGEWDKLNEKLMEQFPVLQKIDFHFEEGKRQDMLKRIEVKIGKTKEELDEVMKAIRLKFS